MENTLWNFHEKNKKYSVVNSLFIGQQYGFPNEHKNVTLFLVIIINNAILVKKWYWQESKNLSLNYVDAFFD